MVDGTPSDLLQQLCSDLRQIWREAGGPTLRTLSAQVPLSKSQIGAIFNGKIRQPPDWDVVKGLVVSIHQYARDHGRTKHVTMRTGVEEFWRPRHTVLEYAFRHAKQSRTIAADDGGNTATTTHSDPVTENANSRALDTDTQLLSAVPQQLPLRTANFVGRDAHLADLNTVLREQSNRPAGATVVITAIAGTAGVGKTALALHWAHQIRKQFPDGQLFVNLQGFHPTESALDPGEVLRGFLEALAVPAHRIPADPPARAALFRTLLTGRRMLIMLDNARDSEQIRQLLPGAPGCLVTVTSRNQLSGLVAVEGAHPLRVDVLSDAEARELLTSRIGAHRTTADPNAVAEIIAFCARLPLALAIVAGRAATHPRFPLSAIADELRDLRGRLDALHGEDQLSDVRVALSWSYRQLNAPVAQLFRLLGLYPGPEISIASAASLANIPMTKARRALTDLATAHLVTEHIPGRFQCHDLLRAYATELAHRDIVDAERRAAEHRVLDHYLHTANAASCLLYSHRDSVAPARAGPGVVCPRLEDHTSAATWLNTEYRVLIAAIDQAARSGHDIHAWQLAWATGHFLDGRGLWRDLANITRIGLEAATRLKDQGAQARILRQASVAHVRHGQHHKAHVCLRRALCLQKEAGDQHGQAYTHMSMAWTFRKQGRHDEAIPHCERALELRKAVEDHQGQAHALNALGFAYVYVGRGHTALAHCQQALTMYRRIGDQMGEAHTLDSLGFAYHRLGEHRRAIVCYQKALYLGGTFFSPETKAFTLTKLGDVCQAAGDLHGAHTSWRQALAIYDQIDHPDADHVRDKLPTPTPTPTPTPMPTPSGG